MLYLDFLGRNGDGAQQIAFWSVRQSRLSPVSLMKQARYQSDSHSRIEWVSRKSWSGR